MSPLQKLTALALIAPLLLAGCAAPVAPDQANPESAEPSAPGVPSPTVEPASGPLFEGDGYSFNSPDGWTIVPADGDLPPLVGNLSDKDGYPDRIQSRRSSSGHIDIEQAELTSIETLGRKGTDVKLRDRVTFADTEFAHASALFDASDPAFHMEQFYVNHGDETYIVTFTFSATVSEADRDAVWGSVLSTWAWS